eukprot:scaffold1623_cov165-Ochromonas_danica.AAC.19
MQSLRLFPVVAQCVEEVTRQLADDCRLDAFAARDSLGAVVGFENSRGERVQRRLGEVCAGS